MRRIQPTSDDAAVTLFSAATALAMPPAQFGVVPSTWLNNEGAVPEFDIELWAAAALTLTNPRVIGLVPHTGTIANDDFTAANATEIMTAVAHGLQTGDGPVQLTTSDGLPAGLALATDYWIIKIDANTFYFAASLTLALAGTKVFITTDGTGTHTLVSTASTKLVSWHDFGLIAASIVFGASAVGGTRDSYTVRVAHRRNVLAYAVAATVSASTISGRMIPIVDQ